MKRISSTVVVAFAACSAFGQGGIIINTYGGGVNAPITYTRTGARLEGTAYLAQLYFGPAGAMESQLEPVLDAPSPEGRVATPAWFGTGVMAGYILSSTGGGNRYTDPSWAAAGAETSFQLRVWAAVMGDTWEEAFSYWGPDAAMGKSDIITVRTSANILDPPKSLLGLQGFSMGPIPEPSVIALGTAGLALLLWRRRR